MQSLGVIPGGCIFLKKFSSILVKTLFSGRSSEGKFNFPFSNCGYEKGRDMK